MTKGTDGGWRHGGWDSRVEVVWGPMTLCQAQVLSSTAIDDPKPYEA